MCHKAHTPHFSCSAHLVSFLPIGAVNGAVIPSVTKAAPASYICLTPLSLLEICSRLRVGVPLFHARNWSNEWVILLPIWIVCVVRFYFASLLITGAVDGAETMSVTEVCAGYVCTTSLSFFKTCNRDRVGVALVRVSKYSNKWISLLPLGMIRIRPSYQLVCRVGNCLKRNTHDWGSLLEMSLGGGWLSQYALPGLSTQSGTFPKSQSVMRYLLAR